MKMQLIALAILAAVSTHANAAYPWLDSSQTFINTIQVSGGTNSRTIPIPNPNCWIDECPFKH